MSYLVEHKRYTVLAALVLLPIFAGCAHSRGPVALDEYVAKPDPNYSFTLVNTIKGEGVTTYVVDLTSQQWRSAEEVDKPIWKHWLVIAKPDVVKHDTALLFIGGGNNTRPAPDKPDGRTSAIAAATGSIVANLSTIPSEPLVFANDGRKRSEDEIIAYGWDKFLRGGDVDWIVRFAMTKGAVKAMDAIQSLMATEQGGKVAVKDFVVSGGSKRGLTTWTTGAVDKRVVSIMPCVIDLLNTKKSFDHHYKVYGFWAPAIGDYQEMHIMDWSYSPQYKKLMQYEDPFQYRDRYKDMPRYMVNASGDQFFIPDSWRFYFHQLPGEKHIRYVPNAEHSLGGTDVAESLTAFYASILNGTKRPEYTWDVSKNGSIHVKTVTKPMQVNVWQASNPDARDFRVDTIGKVWKSTALAESSPGVYDASVPKPEKGFTAFFVEMVYDSGFGVPFKFTSGVSVVPDVYPHGAYKANKANIKN